MTFYKLKLVIITLILLIAGCSKKKDELTLPVRIHLKISTILSIYDQWMSLDGGKIGIQSIRFEGRREAGEDVFFETDPKMNLPTLALPALISEFDIPQGIYNYMKWDITLKRIMAEELIDVHDTDSLSIGLVIPGSYTDFWGEWDFETKIPIIFAVDDIELFSFMPSSLEDNSIIALSANKDYEITLLFDPTYAIHSIARESLDMADRSNVNGSQIIVISSNKNKVLYENLLYRLTQSTKVLIK